MNDVKTLAVHIAKKYGLDCENVMHDMLDFFQSHKLEPLPKNYTSILKYQYNDMTIHQRHKCDFLINGKPCNVNIRDYSQTRCSKHRKD